MNFSQPSRAAADRGGAHGRQRRDSVLRVLTDLFVLEGDRQAPDERERQEGLMIALASEAGQVMRQEVAERLAGLAEPPKRLVQMLARDDIAVAAPLLRHCEALEDRAVAEIVLTTTVKHARAAAARSNPGIATAEAIVAIEDPMAILDLIKNTNVILSKASLEKLCRLARKDGEIATALLARGAMPPLAAASLYWTADSQRRAAILERLEAQDNWPADLNAHKAPMRLADAESRNAAHRGLISIIKAGRTDDFRTLFSRAIGLEPALAERMFADKGGEPFTIACAAAGFSEQDFATLLLLHNSEVGSSVQRVFALRKMFAGLDRDFSWIMLDAWNASLRRKPPAGEADIAEQAPAARQETEKLRGAVYEAVGVRSERVSAQPPARPAPRGGDLAALRPGSGERSAGGRG